jgi:arginine decarboxylase
LDEAADRLTRPTTDGALKERYVAICQDLLTQLTPLEPYWAYPGSPQFAMVQRMFAAGSYDKFAHAVARINRALTTESYRTGDVEHAGLDDNDMFRADPRQLEQQSASLRQGSMIHVYDQDFDQKVAEPFHEAYPANWSTRSVPVL